MQFNVLAINAILNNIGDRTTSDFEVYGKTWAVWQKTFLFSNESYLKLPIEDATEKMNLFKKCGKYDEQKFKEWFPTIKYTKYLNPNDLHEHKRVAISKIQKVAFELNSYIPLEYSLLVQLLADVYFFEDTFTFDSITKRMPKYNPELYVKMIQPANNSKQLTA
jgi:hypothetical protein